MSTDIHGFIEVRPWPQRVVDGSTPWQAAIDLSLLALGESDGFGCLFGVRNTTGLTPLAARRGVPADASDGVRRLFDQLEADFAGEAHSHTWLAWTELEALDWDAMRLLSRIHGSGNVRLTVCFSD